MADITDQHDQTSPTELDEPHSVGNGNPGVGEPRGIKRARPTAADDDDDDDEKGGRERRKIEIKFIADKSRRHITFSKRKAGIMKKVSAPASSELSHGCTLHNSAGIATMLCICASHGFDGNLLANTDLVCSRPTNSLF
jgi:hypothetical protein